MVRERSLMGPRARLAFGGRKVYRQRMPLAKLIAQKSSDVCIGLELCQILWGRHLRLVARSVDHAEETERLALAGTKLVPGHGRHRDEIAGVDGSHLIT